MCLRSKFWLLFLDFFTYFASKHTQILFNLRVIIHFSTPHRMGCFKLSSTKYEVALEAEEFMNSMDSFLLKHPVDQIYFGPQIFWGCQNFLEGSNFIWGVKFFLFQHIQTKQSQTKLALSLAQLIPSLFY